MSGRLAFFCVGLLVIYSFARNLVLASVRPFWFDEVCTWIVARQGGASAVWKALQQAADSHPPLFYLIEQWAARLGGQELVGYRLPAILGVSLIPLCLFLFVRPRAGPLCALVAAFIPGLSLLFLSYGTEARPYGLEAGCVALALVSYQRAESPAWAASFWAGLALAISLHYFAVLLFAVFAVAEAAFWLANRRFRLRVWAALALGSAPLFFFLPLLLAYKRAYGGPMFVLPVSLTGALGTYGSFFNVNREIGAAAAAVMFFALLGAAMWSRKPAVGNSEVPLHETVLLLGLLASPLLAFVAAGVAHGGMHLRYVLPTVLGIAAAAPLLLARLGRGAVKFAAAILVLAFAGQEGSFWLAHLRQRDAVGAPASAAAYVDRAVPPGGEPVVISDLGRYVEMVHAAPGEITRRFIGLADPAAARTYAGTDSLDKLALVLRRFAPLNIYEYPQLAQQRRAFYLFSNGSAYDWWPARLAADGHEVCLITAAPAGAVYHVVLRSNADAVPPQGSIPQR